MHLILNQKLVTETVLDGCTVIVTIDAGSYHMSIAHTKRYPTWDEIKKARYMYCPSNITMAMMLPPLEEYVNVHKNCFHLWEIKGI